MKKPEELKAFAAYVMKLIPTVRVGVGPEKHQGPLTDIVLVYKSTLHEGMQLNVTLTVPDASLEDDTKWYAMVRYLAHVIAEHELKGPHTHEDPS